MSAPDLARTQREGLQGHLRLIAGVDESGRTCLREQSFRAPVHLGKTFYDCGVLTAHIVNPTAGLLEGDELDIDVHVEKDARLLLTNPAATRVHTMKNGRASVRQRYLVDAGGWLEVWPDLFIPQSGARYEQKTRIEVARGGELLFFEILTPGRVASGESFAFDQLDWETDIVWDGTLVARERYLLSPRTASIDALRTPFADACHATCFVIAETLTADNACWHQVTAFKDDNLWIGCSRLVQGGWVIKMLARDGVAMRAGIGKTRDALYAAACWPRSPSRKT